MKLILNAVIACFFIIILSVNSIFAQNPYDIFDGDIRIIDSDNTGITFSYMAPKATLCTPDGYPDEYKTASIPRTAQVAKPGTPLLPVKLVPIGIPFDANPRVSVISQSWLPMAEVKAPNYISESSEQQFQAKMASQVSIKDWPPQIASIEDQVIIRGLKVAKVAIAATKLEKGTLYQAQTITVRVDYNSSNLQKRYSPRPNGRTFEKVMSSVVANYNIARNWRVDWPPIPLRAAASSSAFDSAEVWVKLEIVVSGVYKISRFELNNAGVDMEDVDPRQFRIFYGGGKELPVDNSVPRPEFVEIPINVTGEDDGIFDGEDLILFYGEAADRPIYSESEERNVYLHNHYTSENVYWLSIGGDFSTSPRRWEDIDGTPSTSALTATTFIDIEHVEQDLNFYVDSDGDSPDNYNWYAGSLENFNYNVQLHDVVNGSTADLYVRARSSFDDVTINGTSATYVGSHSGIIHYISTAFRSETSFNTMTVANDRPFDLDYVDILYQRWLNAETGQLKFYGSSVAGRVVYTITNAPSNYILFKIDSPDSTAIIENASFAGGTLEFEQYSNGHNKYYLITPAAYRNVSDIELYEPDNLRSPTNGADYLIITHGNFYEQSLELAAHRESMSPGLRARVVNVQDIYNQFSYGLFDPTAIRDFLKYAFENWDGAPPDYAVLVGDGHYDYRNNWNYNVPNYIPPFHSTDDSARPYGSDENYIYFGDYGYIDSDDSGSLDMIIGRISVNSTDEMAVVLDKIINYEANPDMGKWRNTVIIAADDHLKAPNATELFHTNQAETLANDHVPLEMEIKKIYLVDFPLRSGGVKPDAREALIAAFNEGGLIVNWIGHGNKGLWAHEQLFRRNEDMPRLVNGYKLPLVFAASCSIGYYDDPNEQGMSEDFVRHPGGGGIASIAATRKVYATGNAEINNDLFDQLLFADSVSFGQALYSAKFLRLIPPELPTDNSRKFMLFGDPAVVSGKPVMGVEFTYGPDSLRGLSVDSIAGYVTNDSGVVQTNFNGTIWVLVKDASINYRNYLTDFSGNPTGTYLDYIKPGPTIFYGPASVENGSFTSTFFIPKDITYGGSGAKIFVYFDNGSMDGHGVMDSLPMSGGLIAESDSTGPVITISYNGNQFSNDMQALPDRAILEARIEDDHGVNVTGSMGHSIVIEVDEGETYTADVTDNFVFDMGKWQEGIVTFQLPTLPEGEHQFSLKAWDNYNNSSVFSSYITVYAADEFGLSEVMNYPNPAVGIDSTVFQYMLTDDADRVSLKIFTLTGRKIRSYDLGPEYTTLGYHYLPYNLRDSDGDRLASGVYIYKFEAVGTGLDGAKRKANFVSKLAIIR